MRAPEFGWRLFCCQGRFEGRSPRKWGECEDRSYPPQPENPSLLTFMFCFNCRQILKVEREVKILLQISHPHVANFEVGTRHAVFTGREL
jgi:hypothetical protein